MCAFNKDSFTAFMEFGIANSKISVNSLIEDNVIITKYSKKLEKKDPKKTKYDEDNLPSVPLNFDKINLDKISQYAIVLAADKYTTPDDKKKPAEEENITIKYKFGNKDTKVLKQPVILGLKLPYLEGQVPNSIKEITEIEKIEFYYYSATDPITIALLVAKVPETEPEPEDGSELSSQTEPEPKKK